MSEQLGTPRPPHSSAHQVCCAQAADAHAHNSSCPTPELSGTCGMGLDSYTASTACRLRSVNSPRSPMKVMVVWSAPKLDGKYRSRECTPLNLAALRLGKHGSSRGCSREVGRWERGGRAGRGSLQRPAQPRRLRHPPPPPPTTTSLAFSSQRGVFHLCDSRQAYFYFYSAHSLRGVLYLSGGILQQVPLLHRRHARHRCKVEVIPVDEHLREVESSCVNTCMQWRASVSTTPRLISTCVTLKAAG